MRSDNEHSLFFTLKTKAARSSKVSAPAQETKLHVALRAQRDRGTYPPRKKQADCSFLEEKLGQELSNCRFASSYFAQLLPLTPTK
jgi:hypothetical protein